MIISFSGSPGSGKSSVAERLAKELGWPYYDIGGLRRRFAQDRGMTLEEYNRLGETDSRTDTEVDEYQAELGRTQDSFIIVGRTSWHFIPHSLKIFLFARPEVGAERIFKDPKHRNEGEGLSSVASIMESLERRVASDNFRYQKYFSIDVHDTSNYDWVLDTSDLSQEEVYKQVKAYVSERLGQI